ncbi:hypothetical protein ACRQ5Q_09605 [Bradyrhizobium sp. PMVTL-01]|uniref:hypothetical protein n=1 Tax=Bradyrhizobium sp. PMVTL-01 TaxID=3434999 RepID=UPI003F6ECF9C
MARDKKRLGVARQNMLVPPSADTHPFVREHEEQVNTLVFDEVRRLGGSMARHLEAEGGETSKVQGASRALNHASIKSVLAAGILNPARC